MKELKGKAEFFQQYIIDRFNKLREQRSIGTNTEERPTSPHSQASEHSSIEQLVQDCDDAMAAKVCKITFCIKASVIDVLWFCLVSWLVA